MKSTQQRRIAGISCDFVSFDVIEKMARKGTLRCQRDHVERAARATYLKGELNRDQLVFHAVKLSRTTELADGYTRVERVWLGEVVRPETVLLITHTCKTEEEVVMVYDQLNNPKAAKTGRDRVQEGLRMSKLKGALSSHLVLAGPLASAVKMATGINDVRRATCAAAEAVRFVDQLQLPREKVTSGVFGAILAIALHEPEKAIAAAFIQGVQSSDFDSDRSEDEFIRDVREVQAVRRANRTLAGNAALTEMRDMTLAKYLQYRAALKRPSRMTILSMASEVTLGSFVQTMATVA